MAKYLFIFLFLRPFKCKMGWCDSLTVFTGLIHVNVNVYLFSQVFMYSVIIIFFLFIYPKGQPCVRKTHYKTFNCSSFPLFLYSTIQTYRLLILFSCYYLFVICYFFLFFPIFLIFPCFFHFLLVLLIFRLPIHQSGCGISLRQLREHKQCWKR